MHKQYKCTNVTGQKDKRGEIQFSGYHPLKEVKFVGDEATVQAGISSLWNVSWLLSRRWHWD